MLKLIVDNRDWLFDGVLVAVPLALMSWFLARRSDAKPNKMQQSGHNSQNLQSDGDININVQR